jgi:hypothetical protein
MVKLIIEYANNSNIILDMNNSDNYKKYYPFLYATHHNNIEMAELIIKYANEHDIILNINNKSELGKYPLLFATSKYNSKLVELIINYSSDYNIALSIDEKDITNISKMKTEIQQLFCKYVSKNNINVRCKYSKELSSLAWAINNNSIKMVKLIVQFAIENDIIMEINEKDLKNISEISDEMLVLLSNYEKENSITISFEDESPLLEKFEEIKNISGDCQDELQNQEDANLSFPTTNNDEILDHAIALYDFNGNEEEELNIKKGDHLIILDWNVKDGWVYGYIYDNNEKKGIIPKLFVRKLNNDDEIINYPKENIELNTDQSPTNKESDLQDIQDSSKPQHSPSSSYFLDFPAIPLSPRTSAIYEYPSIILSNGSDDDENNNVTILEQLNSPYLTNAQNQYESPHMSNPSNSPYLSNIQNLFESPHMSNPSNSPYPSNAPNRLNSQNSSNSPYIPHILFSPPNEYINELTYSTSLNDNTNNNYTDDINNNDNVDVDVVDVDAAAAADDDRFSTIDQLDIPYLPNLVDSSQNVNSNEFSFIIPSNSINSNDYYNNNYNTMDPLNSPYSPATPTSPYMQPAQNSPYMPNSPCLINSPPFQPSSPYMPTSPYQSNSPYMPTSSNQLNSPSFSPNSPPFVPNSPCLPNSPFFVPNSPYLPNSPSFVPNSPCPPNSSYISTSSQNNYNNYDYSSNQQYNYQDPYQYQYPSSPYNNEIPSDRQHSMSQNEQYTY